MNLKHEMILVRDEHADAVRAAIARAGELWDEWAGGSGETESGENWGPAGEIKERTAPDGFTLFDMHEHGTDYGCNTLTESGRLDDVLTEQGVTVPFQVVTVEYEFPYSASGSRDRTEAARNLAAAIGSIELSQ